MELKVRFTNFTSITLETSNTFRTDPRSRMTFFTFWRTWFWALRNFCYRTGTPWINKMIRQMSDLEEILNVIWIFVKLNRNVNQYFTINLYFTQVRMSMRGRTNRISDSWYTFVVVDYVLSRVRAFDRHVIRDGVFCVLWVVETTNTLKSIGSVGNVQWKSQRVRRKSVSVNFKNSSSLQIMICYF